jgi:hypothetical protein
MTDREFLVIIMTIITCLVLLYFGSLTTEKREIEFASKCEELGGVTIHNGSNLVCLGEKQQSAN